ncbi:hypothetical protein EUGRSUZ_C00318 [Eucalyptus grandis]|uniref:TIR domain-containing protein n=2 Tax=Eucalyptus grandis TaxID=71139 RepID=A0A059CKA1_EUCGR|nr:hypothetical protein EUGRSUZ_C00318 [Eucalyptus grandis]
MECKESRGQIVLPVLYKVKPKDVKHMLGKFGEAFKSGMHRFKEDVKQQGPEALREALTLRVYESEVFASGHEGELVNELVETILRQQQYDLQPHLPLNLVAIEDRVAKVMELMDLACPNTRIIGIWGMGGIGKTTLAMIIYKKLFDKFHYHSSLKDIRETIKMEGIKHVQSLLISDITKSPPHSVHNSDIGIAMIRLSCENKNVLILLDDVGHQDDLNKLIGGCNFGLGSRIIITCRDKAVLKSEYERYELNILNPNDSLILFSRCAFEREQPPKDLATLSSDIVATTGGLPLALVVVGSLLKGEKDQMIWEERLEKLRMVPHEDVREKLKISYDTLSHAEKEIFLDIACFFIGTDKRIATYFWADLKFFPRTELQKLISRSLIKIDYENRLRMHDQLRDLGRIIACPVEKKPWKWSRLWDEEAMKVLQRKFLHVKDVDFDGDFERSLAELRWLKCERCRDSFEATNMERLKVLNLSWCSKLKSNPNLSAFENLELLILKGCANLKEIDPSIQYAKRLLILNLSYCESLEMLPEQLGELENLEELVVDDTRIKEIPSCIGSLKKLKRLSARIKELPESIGKLNKLEILDIYGSEIERIPSSIGKLQSLQKLEASCSNLKGQIIFDKGGLSSLKTLALCQTKISGLPENLDQLSSLEQLDLFECEELESLPKPPCSLLSLWLTCRSNELPSLSHLNHLQDLWLYGCGSLQSIPSLSHLKRLQKLILWHCDSLQSIPSLSHRLQELNLWHCDSLQSIPSLSHSKRLQTLSLDRCDSLQSIPSLSHLKHLQTLGLCDCKSLQEIPELPSCIRELYVSGFPKLETLPNLSDLEFLSVLSLMGYEGLKKLDGLEALKSLRKLNLWKLFIPSTEPGLSNLDGFDEQPDDLRAIEGLEKLESLEEVNIRGREHIQVLDLSKSEHLKELIVTDCKSLVEIRCPSKFLQRFARSGCESLKKLPDFFIEES